jgi:hypothetical protein
MRTRYYDAMTQRFISREPLWPWIRDPRQINPYQYANSDPVKWVDIDGRDQSSTGSSITDEIGEGIAMGADFRRVLNLDESVHVPGMGSVPMGNLFDIYYNNQDWQMLYKMQHEAGYKQEVREGERTLREQQKAWELEKKKEQLRQEELEKKRMNMITELMQGGLEPGEAEAFVYWLQKQNFGAVRIQREIDFALEFAKHKGKRNSVNKVKGVWVGVPGMGRMFFPGAFIQEGKVWNAWDRRWMTKSEYGAAPSDPEIFREGLGPAEGFDQVY